MGTVRASAAATGASVHQAQQAWCECSRWGEWVEGLAEVEYVDAAWPAPGAAVRWRSGPAGRGSVTETVLRYEPLELVESEVEDDQVVARQLVWFAVAGGGDAGAGGAGGGVGAGVGVEIVVELAYRIKRRSPLIPLVDAVFVRGAMRRSLSGTLARFARALES